jgi:DNA-binding response OmpR family regulator
MSNERILVVEDEPSLLQGLEINLSAQGYSVMTASRGDDGLHQAMSHRPDLVLLDVMLPGLNGFDVCRQLRGTGFEAPILMLTARSEEIDRVAGFEIGADDYVTKPFGVRELMARIRARLKPRTDTALPVAPPKLGEITLDLERHVAIKNDERIELTGKEAAILRTLGESNGRIVTRDRLLEAVWGRDVHVTARTVDNHILRLRQKLEIDPANPRHILSVYGEGYKLCW